MAESNALPLVLLAEQFAKLPGIGMKSAQRLAYYVMSMTDEDASAFAAAITNAHKSVHLCSVCQNFTDKPKCPICAEQLSSVLRSTKAFTMFCMDFSPLWTTFPLTSLK